MPRTKLINPKRSWNTRLPEDLAARVLSDLFSEAEGCVPYGAWSKFIELCVREHYQRLSEQRVQEVVDMSYEPSCNEANIPPVKAEGIAAAGDPQPAAASVTPHDPDWLEKMAADVYNSAFEKDKGNGP